MQTSDAELLVRSRTSVEAFGVIYTRHAPAVHRYLSRRAGAGIAEDLLAEVFTVAVEARLRVKPHASGSALPWLYGIARNVLRAHLRQRSSQSSHDDSFDLDWDAVDARLDASSLRSRLRHALEQLSPGEREVLLLVGWEQLTVSEAAEALGISGVAARSRLHRARTRAESLLSAISPEPHRQDS
ncbi:RNA polymerase sigma factor [Aeromicrobium ginsengisoli]|nr:sigma-70 family RNA polymerase sigma factor [Aeromicrobium ginsengisoli]